MSKSKIQIQVYIQHIYICVYVCIIYLICPPSSKKTLKTWLSLKWVYISFIFCEMITKDDSHNVKLIMMHKETSSLTWLLRISVHTHANNISWGSRCLVEVTIRKKGSLRSADNTGPSWWDVVLRRRAPAVNHGPRDWSVQVPCAGGWGLLPPVEEQLVRREGMQLVFVLLVIVGLAVRIFSRIFLLPGLFLALFLSISVHAEWYWAVGVCEVFVSIVQAIAQASLWGWSRCLTAGPFSRRWGSH